MKKSSKLKELKSNTEAELLKVLSEKSEHLRLFRFKLSGSQTKHVKEGKHLRVDIARVMTELKVREMNVMPKKA